MKSKIQKQPKDQSSQDPQKDAVREAKSMRLRVKVAIFAIVCTQLAILSWTWLQSETDMFNCILVTVSVIFIGVILISFFRRFAQRIDEDLKSGNIK